MNRTTVFSKTGKGLLEIKNKSNRLSKDQFRVLNLVDGKATLDDLVDKSRITEVELRKVLAALADGGFIKEFTNPTATGDYTSVTIPPVPPSTSYVDDLDFTQILGPAKSAKPGFYQSAQTEQRQREESERKASEAAATRAREEAEKRGKEESARRAHEEESARRIREEAERKAKEEQARREKLEAEMRYRLEEPKRLKEEAERKAREKLEAEKRAREEVERKAREEAERRAKIQAEAAARVEAERKRREEEEARKRKEEEERRRREEEERKRLEEEERKRLEEEERKRREEEERKRREEEERKRREEEERKRKEEEERKRREEEERKRREEEERKRREEEERKRKEEEERKRKQEEEERKRKQEEERKRREEEERKRKEEEERQRKEEEERRRKEEAERLRRELDERHRREEEELLRRLEQGPPSEEEQRKQREAEESQRREEERRQEEERSRRENEERKRREEEERRQRANEERSRRDEEERRRQEEQRNRSNEDEESSWSPLPTLEVTAVAAPAISRNLDSDFDALKRAEAEVEKEFMAKEEAIRKALEEQERRFRLEEEARAAMDRAEREAREKADQEGRELAEAAERARRDAEQRAREESARRQQEDKEKRAKEQEERKKKGEEDRKKRERERREQEQRAREEALAKKRADQENLDRKKSERERLAREAKKRAWGPGRIALVAGIAIVTLLIGAIQVAPLSAYAPEMEKLASERIGEPVRIGAVHASVFPAFHLKMESVTVGKQQDVRVPSVIAYMDIGSVFSGEKLIKSLEIDQLQATQDVLGRLPGWLADDGTKGASIKIRRIVLKGTKLEVKGAALPAFNAQVYLAEDGNVTRAMVDTVDGHFDAEISVAASGAEINARVKNFSPPLGPRIEVTEGTVKGVLSGNQIRLSEMDLYLYGGQAKGQAVFSWGPPWSLEGDFDLRRIDLEAAMKALKIDISSEGLLDAKGRYALQANALAALFDNPRVEATFNVQKGALSSFDFVRALQAPTRDGVQGGKTKFDDLSGTLSVGGGRYTYSNARLRAGLLAASGACEILPDREINGRAYVELRSSSNIVKNTFKITGTLKAIVLKP
jgi:hypothetical protein